VAVESYSWTPEERFEPFEAFDVVGFGAQAPVVGADVVLDDVVESRLSDLWAKAKAAVQSEVLHTPLTRFADSFTRRRDGDRLLDFWMALESLFLPQDLESELRQTAPVAMGFYLAANEAERREIYDAVMVSYDWRSYLIHGERSPKKRPKEVTLGDITDRTYAYLREALRKRVREL